MDVKKRNENYNKYVDAKKPQTRNFPTLIYAYIIGGLICMLGQFILDMAMMLFPTMSLEQAQTWMLILLIALASLTTGLGLYDRLGAFAGGGSIVPITGFSNSVTSPAMEYKKEGIIFGVCVKMFSVAGPVIVNGVLISIIVGIIYLFI
jgi:stage V sporulation protein AC